MLSWQEDQQTRLEVQENDRRVREERAEKRRPDRPSTFNQFAQSDADLPRDRFHEVNSGSVVGAKSDIAALYPAASFAHQTELPPEKPLGHRIDDLGSDNPTLEPPPSASALATGEPAAPLTEDNVQRGSPLSHKDDDPVTLAEGNHGLLSASQMAGSSSPIRRF